MMLKCLVYVLTAQAITAMKRTAPDQVEPSPKRQNTGQILPVDSPFQDIPLEIMNGHILPEMSPADQILLSMTCKANHQQFYEGGRKACSTDMDSLYQDLVEAGEEGGSPRFESLRRLFTIFWPRSHDCVVRLDEQIALNGALCHAAGIPLLAPSTYSFTDEQKTHYKSSGPCKLPILQSKIFNKITLTADLASEVPLDLLEEYKDNITRYVPFQWKSYDEFAKLVKRPDILKKMAGSEMLECSLEHGVTIHDPMFDEMIRNGLDDLDFENRDDYNLFNDVEKCYFEEDHAPVILALELANEGNYDKLICVLNLIDGTNARGFTKILCTSPKLSDETVILVLFQDMYLDYLLTFAMMIDSGRVPRQEWVLVPGGVEAVRSILPSYSRETNTFTAEIEVDSWQVDFAIYAALFYNSTDEALLALIRQGKSFCPIGLFFLLLEFGRSENFIKQVLELHDPVIWRSFYYQNIPSNIDIPTSLLPYVIARLKRVQKLAIIIPDHQKYLAAVTACQQENFWTDEFTLISLIKHELFLRRPLVLQGLLNLACTSDWLNFVVQPIIDSTNLRSEDMRKLLLSEYLWNFPSSKLFEAVDHNKELLSVEMFEDSDTNDIQRSMLPLIFYSLMNRLDGFKMLMDEYQHLCLAAVKKSWSNMFPSEISPFEDSSVLISTLKKLVEYMSFGQFKANMLAQYVAYLIVQQGVEVPEELRAIRRVKVLLQSAKDILQAL